MQGISAHRGEQGSGWRSDAWRLGAREWVSDSRDASWVLGEWVSGVRYLCYFLFSLSLVRWQSRHLQLHWQCPSSSFVCLFLLLCCILVGVSTAVRKYNDHKQLGKERGLSHLRNRLAYSIVEGIQQQEPGGRKWCRGIGGTLLAGLACSVWLLIAPRTTALGCTTHSGLGPPSDSSQQSVPQSCLQAG